MWWLKLATKIIFLITPLSILFSAGYLFLIFPHLGPTWWPGIFLSGLVGFWIANAIWPLEDHPPD